MTAERHDDPAVDLLLQREAVHDVMNRYASGVDKRDMELVASCFTPDVDAQAWGFTNRDDLVQFISGVAAFHTTMHMMGNQFIDVDGDTATMTSYAMLTHHGAQADGTAWELNLSRNRYVEDLVLGDDGWVIRKRGSEPNYAIRGVDGVASQDGDVQWLLDRAALHDLMMQYAVGIDLREYDRHIRPCFADVFHAAYGPVEHTDIDELLTFIKGVEHFESTNHFLGTSLIEIDGDRAAMETYAMITHREGDGGAQEWMAGGSTYRDELARVDGRWVITERGEGARHVGAQPPGRRTSTDPTVQRLLDRASIHDVVATSALAVDRKDWALLDACFAKPGAAEDIRAEADQWHRTFHFLNNQIIELDGDEATVETYAYITHHDGPDTFASPWAQGARRLVDRLTLTAAGWRLVDRQVLDNRSAP